MYACIHFSLYIYMYNMKHVMSRRYICINIYVYIYIYGCIYIYACVHFSLYVYMYNVEESCHADCRVKEECNVTHMNESCHIYK